MLVSQYLQIKLIFLSNQVLDGRAFMAQATCHVGAYCSSVVRVKTVLQVDYTLGHPRAFQTALCQSADNSWQSDGFIL